MFTGIITAIGQIEELKDTADRWLKITTPWACDKIDLGASICLFRCVPDGGRAGR